MPRPLCPLALIALLSTTLFASNATGQTYDILEQKLDSKGEGYTVIRVWGTRQQIGHAIGSAFAEDILQAAEEVRSQTGTKYSSIRSAMNTLTWLPIGVEEEFDGLVQGVKSVFPETTVDVTDMKVLNTFGDWSYACRSHSSWGSRNQAPYSTLSTRRLDFGSPLAVLHHHVLYAIDPSDEPVRWVNLAWPGFISVATGVNQYGTLVSVHDFNSSVVSKPDVLSRTMAARHLLSSVPALPTSQHLSWGYEQLVDQPIATGTFINFYAPDGHGGVFTCDPGAPCSKPRLPQNDYFGGEVLITTNSQTDGHTTPSGASFLDPYYNDPTPKSIEDHFDVMVDNELHMMTVGFRADEDMRLLAHGRTKQGWTPRIDVEWSTLFPTSTPDAGVDSAIPEAGHEAEGGNGMDSGKENETSTPDEPSGKNSDDGCSCTVPGHPMSKGWPLVVLGLMLGGLGRPRAKRS